VIFTALDPGKIPLLPSEKIEIINKSRGYTALIDYVRTLTRT
jgi:hypothetical protein